MAEDASDPVSNEKANIMHFPIFGPNVKSPNSPNLIQAPRPIFGKTRYVINDLTIYTF